MPPRPWLRQAGRVAATQPHQTACRQPPTGPASLSARAPQRHPATRHLTHLFTPPPLSTPHTQPRPSSSPKATGHPEAPKLQASPTAPRPQAKNAAPPQGATTPWMDHGPARPRGRDPRQGTTLQPPKPRDARRHTAQCTARYTAYCTARHAAYCTTWQDNGGPARVPTSPHPEQSR